MRKALQILGSLDDADIEWMARAGTSRFLDAGSVLIEEGSYLDSLFIVLEGQLVVRIGADQQREVASLLAGEIVGEISFVDDRKTTASVVAQTRSKLLVLSRKSLSDELRRDAGFAARFYRAIASFLADRLSVTTTRLGYGNPAQDAEVDAIEDTKMDEISLAAIRFDKLLRHLGDRQDSGSFASVPL